MFDPVSIIRKLGHASVERIWRLGFAARFMWALLMHSGSSFRRLPLTLREIYFSGVLSLLIIMVSGLFVGLVLGHYGYRIQIDILDFIRNLGLILFVYGIGIQVGPSFFSSFRKEGLRFNALAVGTVILGGVVT